jgi:uncharacterized protein
MKSKIILLALSLASASTLPAQTSVWKATKGDRHLYLGGTCHILRPSDLPLPAEFDQAYAGSSKVVFETDLARAQSAEMQKIVAERGMFAGGDSLEKALGPEAWQAVQDYCAGRGIPPAQVNRMRPWFFLVLITVMEFQKRGVTQEGVDLRYFKKAKADGKSLGELETFESHVEFLTGMAGAQPARAVRQTLGDLAELDERIGEILAGWRKGDLEGLDRTMLAEMRADYPDVYRALIVQRNENWLPIIEELAATPEVEFVLAGVGHMAGDDGLLASLRKRGYTIEQVVAAPAVAK